MLHDAVEQSRRLNKVWDERNSWRNWALFWFIAAIFWMLATVFISTGKARADDTDPLKTYRQDLAKETFNFLYAHALCVEGEEKPCDWVYDGAYEVHRAAVGLYSSKPLKEIPDPTSDWARGGYENYLNPLDYLEHEWIMLRIHLLIRYGVSGIPPRHPANLGDL